MNVPTLLVHERVTEMGGSELVVAQLLRLLPGARLFAPIVDTAVARDIFGPDLQIETSWLQRAYREGSGSYSHLLPFLPKAMSTAPVNDAELVVTSHHAFANRMQAPHHVPVISYVHSPARWMWDASKRKGEGPPIVGEPALTAFSATQRRADRAAAQRLTGVVANSSEVADRVQRWWGLSASVVAPPVDVDFFTPAPDVEREDFFLYAGRMVPYKRPDVAVRAALKAGQRITIAGSGRSVEECQQLAASAPAGAVTFETDVSRERMRDLFRRCRALVFPGIEDFGIVPVEAQACGAPVIGVDRGGLRDSVVDGSTGLLVPDADDVDVFVDRVAETIATFDDGFDPSVVRKNAEQFSEASFLRRMGDAITSILRGVNRGELADRVAESAPTN